MYNLIKQAPIKCKLQLTLSFISIQPIQVTTNNIVQRINSFQVLKHLGAMEFSQFITAPILSSASAYIIT